MKREPVWVCTSAMLGDGGKGVRFSLSESGNDMTGFVIRYDGRVHAYLNRCAHVPMELDWTPGEFFEASGLYLMCATHGAIYEPDSGRCVGGPCRGKRLQSITVTERDDQIFWHPDEIFQPLLHKGH